MWVVLARLQRVDTLRLPLFAGLHENGVCPENAGVGAVLKCLGHVGSGNVDVIRSLLNTHRMQPENRGWWRL